MVAEGEPVFTSSISVFELWYGVSKSARPESNAERLKAFLAGPLDVLPFEAPDAAEAGDIRAGLEKRGAPIGAYDLLIAGQALHRRARLITANASGFARVPGLDWEDWSDA